MHLEQGKPIVFFSWQSDLDVKTNRNVISDCLRDICKKNSLIFDEATNERCGSPDIASTIEEKIRNADIFVADVTIINAGTASKTTPNPNVLFELGIAQATLGWDRIILIVNTAYAPISDLPFDIKSHRVLNYSLSAQDAVGLSNKQKTTRIFESLKNGILSILNKNPLKEILKGNNPKQIQYNKDYKKLEDLLDYFHFDSIQDFCEDGPKDVGKYMLLFQKHLTQEVKKPSFIFYDKELETLIKDIHSTLNKCIPSSAPYRPNSDRTRLTWEIPFDVFPTKDDEKLFYSAVSACRKLDELIRRLAYIVHERFPGINLDVKSGLNGTDFLKELLSKSR